MISWKSWTRRETGTEKGYTSDGGGYTSYFSFSFFHALNRSYNFSVNFYKREEIRIPTGGYILTKARTSSPSRERKWTLDEINRVSFVSRKKSAFFRILTFINYKLDRFSKETNFVNDWKRSIYPSNSRLDRFYARSNFIVRLISEKKNDQPLLRLNHVTKERHYFQEKQRSRREERERERGRACVGSRRRRAENWEKLLSYARLRVPWINLGISPRQVAGWSRMGSRRFDRSTRSGATTRDSFSLSLSLDRFL